MNLDALGNIGDFVGGIGVVVTLVYLATQIRHNTQGLEQNSQLMTLSFENEFRHDLLEFRLTIATDRELSHIWHAGLEDPGQLDPQQRDRFELLTNNVIALMSAQFDARSRGLYEFTRAPYLRWVVSNPGFAVAWDALRARTTQREAELGNEPPNPGFTAYMESLMRPGAAPPPPGQ